MKTFFGLLWFVLLGCGLGAQTSPPYSSYGGVFTPKGNVHALVVLVRLKDAPQSNPAFSNANAPLDGWPADNNWGLPDQARAERCELTDHFFASPDDLETRFEEVQYNFSKEWYWVSLGQFLFTAELFSGADGRALAVEVDPTGAAGWGQLNQRAVEQMRLSSPDFDARRFDRRQNNPAFRFDNSDTLQYPPDGKIDYIIFLYRYRPDWAQQPVPGMNRWTGSGGGFAGIGSAGLERLGGLQCSEGFTMMYGSGVFLHEIAHTLYNAPHVFGCNHTVGDYFFTGGGWGFTAGGPVWLRGMNAWERWYAGFTEPVAALPHPLPKDTVLRFVLRDFQTTGDALRLRLPVPAEQYLWLEYHRGDHPLDRHPWAGQLLDGQALGDSPSGIYAFVERMTGSRNTIINALSDRCNGLKALNAAGNWDYEVDPNQTPVKNAWGNELYEFRRVRPNPLSGYHPAMPFRIDTDGDGRIRLDRNYNATKQEYLYIAAERIGDSLVRHYHNFGIYDPERPAGYRSPALGSGDVLDCTTNPPLLNYPRFDARERFEPLVLHDYRIRIGKISAGGAEIELSRRPLRIERDLRWAAPELLLPCMDNGAADLTVASGKTLRINRSPTACRTQADSSGRFDCPTVWRIQSGCKIVLEKRAQLLIEQGSQIIIEGPIEIELQTGARWTAQPGCSFDPTRVRWLRAKKSVAKW